MKHLKVIKNLTQIKLEEPNICLVASRELLWFVDMFILLTRFIVPSRTEFTLIEGRKLLEWAE